jgi:hypothetical protein
MSRQHVVEYIGLLVMLCGVVLLVITECYADKPRIVESAELEEVADA